MTDAEQLRAVVSAYMHEYQERFSEKPAPSVQRRVRGVHPHTYFDRTKYLFAARIKVNRVSIFLGDYDDQIMAMRAYDCAARFVYGRRAILNFPDDPPAAGGREFRKVLEKIRERYEKSRARRGRYAGDWAGLIEHVRSRDFRPTVRPG
jgi:hypothetical protein